MTTLGVAPTRQNRNLKTALAAAILLVSPGVRAEPPAKAEACLACHTRDGAAPLIAGQKQQYLATQLYFFREGDRKDAAMSPVAADLTNADLNDLATFFAAEKPAPPDRAADPGLTAKVQELVARNRCNICHGASLDGAGDVPLLAGQKRDYLARQLRAFRDGTRAGLNGIMGDAAQPLGDADIDLLADYLSTLAAP